MKEKRKVYRLRWNKTNSLWMLVRPDKTVQFEVRGETKVQFIGFCRFEARNDQPSQLVVYGKNGRIQFENTYGADPRRSKG